MSLLVQVLHPLLFLVMWNCLLMNMN